MCYRFLLPLLLLLSLAQNGPAEDVLQAPTFPTIQGVELPAQQPLLNAASRYPIGNGVVVAVCDPTGQIETVFGPGYTTSDLISGEDFWVDVDHAAQPIRAEIRRAAGTGVFYGVALSGDINVGIVDYTCRNQPWILRLIVVRNNSATASHSIVIRDIISPLTDKGYANRIAKDRSGHPAGFVAQADTSTGVSSWFPNPVDQSVLIAFNGPASSAVFEGQKVTLQSGLMTLAPGEQREISLTHYFLAGHDLTDAEALHALRSLDAHANLRKSITEWKGWFGNVAPAYALSKIKDPRGHVMMEGALVILKTNESKDGGVIAHTTHYKEGYVRDAAMAIRGLLAAGHTEEAKEWLLWCAKKLSIDQHFADAMSCSVSLNKKNSDFDMGNEEVEEPGWVLLVARDYYAQTHDLSFLKSIDRTLRFAVDVQLKEFEANGGKLGFNGDETELCGAIDMTATGCVSGGSSSQVEWSLSSVAMVAASLDFYIDYLKAAGGDPANYRNAQTKTTMNLLEEEKKLIAAMDRDFWRTDVPEFSGGFHDFFRAKADGAWPKARLVNFTLMPIFFGTDYPADEKSRDVAAMASFFDAKTGFLPLVPGTGTGMEGQDLGYLLWGLVETGNARRDAVYSALVNSVTSDAWGSFSEAYDAQGHPNGHDLRSLETGVNVSALAKYWGLGTSTQ